jgi:uncharacterized protein YjbI with pentapeptide repeats
MGRLRWLARRTRHVGGGVLRGGVVVGGVVLAVVGSVLVLVGLVLAPIVLGGVKRLSRLRRRVERVVGGVRWDLVASGGGVLVLVAVLLAAIVYLPPLAIDSHGLSRTDWLTHVESLRASMLQGLGGLALLGTVYFSARTLRLNRRGQLTERFTKAIEQLGSEKLAVRLGGIYALEQIALDSAELHWPVMEVLTAYLREHSHTGADVDPAANLPERRLPADHHAIATVIGRRRREQDPAGQRLDLHATMLPGVLWARAHLEGASLEGAHLQGASLEAARLQSADLSEARLEGSNLREAHLEGASLDGAHLEDVMLVGARLEEAKLYHAHVERAHLQGASLEGTSLHGASLEGANLNSANLQGASLFEARLEGADLTGADLRETLGLTWEQLQGADGARWARLPNDLASRRDQVMG